MGLGRILIIGATGYIGGRLVARLLDSGYRLRVMGRSPAKLCSRPWASHQLVETVSGDVLNPLDLMRAVEGCRAAYYLASPGGEEAEIRAAINMAAASGGSSLEQIISVGWLGRRETAGSAPSATEILRSGPVPLTHLQVGGIIGSGSAFFEMVRYISERHLVIFAPAWMQAPIQPISIRNLLDYLAGCIEKEETRGRSFEVGGPDIVTFEELVRSYSETAGLKKRIFIPARFVSTRASSLLIHLLTPIPAAVAGQIARSISGGAVCSEETIRHIIPVQLLDSREAVRRALDKTERHRVEVCWTDAGALVPPEWTWCGDEEYAGGTVLECGYMIRLKTSPENVWDNIVRIGGITGWYYGDWLWRLRGLLDKLVGGTSLGRGRKHPSDIRVGDALDFWRVLSLSPPWNLLLLSEMKMPGEAILEFRITQLGDGQVELRQLSRFLPRGLPGLLYWYSLYLAHQWLFRGMLRNIAAKVGAPIIDGPRRFTPKIQPSCRPEVTDRAGIGSENPPE